MVILVTGIAGRFAQLVAGTLGTRTELQVLGVDHSVDGLVCPGVMLAQSELRGPALLELLRTSAVEVVVHLAQPGEEAHTGRAGRLQTFELLGACAAAGVQKVVLRSSTLVYGASLDTPLIVGEITPLGAVAAPGLQSDYVAIERFAATFRKAHPKPKLVLLRCAGIAGGGVSSPLARYLSTSRPCTAYGFNPRIQVLHALDAVVAFVLAVLEDYDGPFNLAAEQPLPLEQAIRLAGAQPLGLPSMLLNNPLLQSVSDALPFDSAFLRYSCVADTRRARMLLGWAPHYSAAQALGELAAERIPAQEERDT